MTIKIAKHFRAAWIVALWGALAGAASSCSTDKVPPGKSCVVQSDCPSPLACSYGRCHVACREARDCASHETCVTAPAGQICLLTEEASCALNSQCPLGLFCAQDLSCRSQCEEDRDCATATQVCVLPDKVCAEPRDVSDGHLILASLDGGLPRDDAAASGGAGGQGSGGAGGGNAGGAGGAGTMNVAGRMGGGAGSGQGGGGTSGGGSSGPCAGPEASPNDALDQASALVIGTPATACLEKDSDRDDYRFTVPADPGGGYARIAITNVGPGASVRMRVFAVSDTALLYDKLSPVAAQSNLAYLAVAPGASYVVEVSVASYHSPTPYALNVTYGAIDDTYEPNDNRFDAKPMTVGNPLTAFLFAGYAKGMIGSVDDYYKLSLADGTVHVGVDIFPTNAAPHVWLLDGNGAIVKEATSGTLGSGVTLPVATVSAGDFYVRVGTFTDPTTQAGAGPDLPDNFTRPYRLTVTQP